MSVTFINKISICYIVTFIYYCIIIIIYHNISICVRARLWDLDSDFPRYSAAPWSSTPAVAWIHSWSCQSIGCSPIPSPFLIEFPYIYGWYSPKNILHIPIGIYSHSTNISLGFVLMGISNLDKWSSIQYLFHGLIQKSHEIDGFPAGYWRLILVLRHQRSISFTPICLEDLAALATGHQWTSVDLKNGDSMCKEDKEDVIWLDTAVRISMDFPKNEMMARCCGPF